MNDHRFTRVRARAAHAAVLAALLLANGCNRADDHAHDAHGHDDHAHEHAGGHDHPHTEAHDPHDDNGDEHGHEHEAPAPRTDPHHQAEHASACSEDVELPAGALERYGILVEPARAIALVPRVSAPGHLAFPQGSVAHVGSALVGRIAAVHVRTGDSVARGDALLVVESPELGAAQSDYLNKRLAAASTLPAVELARDAHERAKKLHESVQGVALAEVQRREAELRERERERDLARVAETAAADKLRLFGLDEAALRELETTGKLAPRLTLTAPIAGRVVELAATLGALVTADTERLVVIGDLSTLWAIAEVSESRLAEVALGAPARVSVPAFEHATHEGRVAAVPVTLEAMTRTAEVRIEVPNPDGKLLPGMFIQVEIDSTRGAGAPVLAVPDGAVLTIEGSPSVFVPLAPGSSTFCKHAVRVGTAVGEHVPVLDGLAEGDLVVVAGAFLLKAEHGKATARHEH